MPHIPKAISFGLKLAVSSIVFSLVFFTLFLDFRVGPLFDLENSALFGVVTGSAAVFAFIPALITIRHVGKRRDNLSIIQALLRYVFSAVSVAVLICVVYVGVGYTQIILSGEFKVGEFMIVAKLMASIIGASGVAGLLFGILALIGRASHGDDSHTAR